MQSPQPWSLARNDTSSCHIVIKDVQLEARYFDIAIKVGVHVIKEGNQFVSSYKAFCKVEMGDTFELFWR